MTDSAHLDKVAEAIWRADPFRMGDPDTWTGEGDQSDYRRMAQAAIDALQLTERQRTFYDQAEPYSTAYEYRLVTPWVRVDGGDQ